jgi:hypothetical protein
LNSPRASYEVTRQLLTSWPTSAPALTNLKATHAIERAAATGQAVRLD